MTYPFSNRLACMDRIRRIVAIDPWFASYALEQLCVEVDIRELNWLANSLEGLLEHPETTGNARLEKLLKERYGE